jgi:hypothetical protein
VEGGVVSEPAEITWDENGVTVTSASFGSDGFTKAHIEQSTLRWQVIAQTRPRIPMKQLAHVSGLSRETIYAFTQGRRTLQREHALALSDALALLLGGGRSQTKP